MDNKDYKWNIDLESIQTKPCKKAIADYFAAKSQMQSRTYHHELYGLLAKNKSIHEWHIRKTKRNQYFSEGSTQYILRKTLADTIQRVPDGELITSYDKNSKENILCQYLFKTKVMWESYNNIDMLSNLTNTFKMAFIYAFAPVRTGFVKDNGEVRISYNLESWADVFVNPDCKDVRDPETVWFRQYLTKAEVENLIDEKGNVSDTTYHADTIKYILDHDMFTAKQGESEKLADKLKNSTSLYSLELITCYKKGDKEFVTYVPSIKAKFRTVKNYDPQLKIPWTFFVLETDPDFPLGVSQVEFLLADQQFNDLFQTSAYKNLLLAMEPPIMVSGWETTPSSYRFEPRKIWNIGNNPNNKVEPVKIDNSVLSNWSETREAIAAAMSRNLLVMDGTLAKDSGTTYSKTAPGVAAQQDAKTININQYQKRMEYFISIWAEKSMRMYLNSMGGVHELTVDEETRRKLEDIGEFDIINDTKVSINFDDLTAESIEFKVRAGSLVQLKETQERAALAELTQPFIQNLNGWSEENRKVIENEVLLPAAKRMLELSDVDMAQTMADSLSTQMAKLMLADMQGQIDTMAVNQAGQQEQIDQLQQQVPAQPEQEQQSGALPVANSGAEVEGIQPGLSEASAPQEEMIDMDPYGLVEAEQQQASAQPTIEDLMTL